MSIERKLYKTLIDGTPNASQPTYEAIGKDLEEFGPDLNADVEKKKNVLGENSIRIGSYEPEADVDPLYAEVGSKVFEFLQDIADNRKTGDACKTTIIDVHLWEETAEDSGIFKAFREEVFVEVKKVGGDTTGYQIPYAIHYTNNRVAGTFNTADGTFTPGTNS